MADNFFAISRGQSLIKAEIVSKYFDRWAKVILPTVQKTGDNRIGYVDFFAGPGRYEDGTESTPLAVLKNAIADPALAKALVATFIERDPKNAESLTRHLENFKGIGALKHQP